MRIEKHVFRLEVPVSDTLAVKILNAGEHLLETTLDLGFGHAALFDGRIEISARAKLHHLTPVRVLILNEIDCLDDIDVMKCRRDAKLGRQFLDILLFRLVLASFPKLLDRIEFFHAPIPLVGEPDDRRGTLTHRNFTTHAILLTKTGSGFTCDRFGRSTASITCIGFPG